MHCKFPHFVIPPEETSNPLVRLIIQPCIVCRVSDQLVPAGIGWFDFFTTKSSYLGGKSQVIQEIDARLTPLFYFGCFVFHAANCVRVKRAEGGAHRSLEVVLAIATVSFRASCASPRRTGRSAGSSISRGMSGGWRSRRIPVDYPGLVPARDSGMSRLAQ